MARSDVIILLRRLLKRMEQEEWTLDEKLGRNVEYKRGFKEYQANGRDTYTLKFNGPKRESHIPSVTIVWEDGSVSSEHWKDITGLTHEGLKPVYKYCPIKLNTIVPGYLLLEVMRVFQLNHVSTIEE